MLKMILGKKTQPEPMLPSQNQPEQSQPPEPEMMPSQAPEPEMPQGVGQEELQAQLGISSQETIEEPTHFDDLIGQSERQEQERQTAQISAKMLNKEEFRASFIGMHSLAAAMSGIKAIALPNSNIQEATANEIADMFYETILDIPLLHFMLQPGNKWLGRGMLMLVYVQGMRGAILEELREKDQPKEQETMSFSKAKKAAKGSGEDGLTPDQLAALGV